MTLHLNYSSIHRTVPRSMITFDPRLRLVIHVVSKTEPRLRGGLFLVIRNSMSSIYVLQLLSPFTIYSLPLSSLFLIYSFFTSLIFSEPRLRAGSFLILRSYIPFTILSPLLIFYHLSIALSSIFLIFSSFYCSSSHSFASSFHIYSHHHTILVYCHRLLWVK